jgi:hypothetical protein
MRYATFKLESGLEVSVTPLSGAAGSTLANVNRWRGQIGLGPIDEAELDTQTERIDLEGGAHAILVDMTGSGGTGGKSMMPPFAGMQRPTSLKAGPSRSRLRYELPAGWTEAADASGMRAASFRIDQDGKQADMAVTPLGGPAGGTLANVNRWRGQIGLGPVTEQQLESEKQEVTIGDQQGLLFDLHGSEQSILAALLEQNNTTWFFKMTGPQELLAKQKSSMLQFLKSVRFE